MLSPTARTLPITLGHFVPPNVFQGVDASVWTNLKPTQAATPLQAAVASDLDAYEASGVPREAASVAWAG
jgi:hypothetical protein